ncbi:hypothetical protein PV08_01066 [Exophiala spinifera]|uniref:NACHT domain-containing protein n=1 Tax=Exophiala spinifera TaxID=91928 RepID=A0A0D1YYZ1_9EURO|nr:uncharacterized protein PV08_01066 [Exophiala spinifera]KIW20491.1 hypothetical protein PV08_01066 [Exophiala spinifera]
MGSELERHGLFVLYPLKDNASWDVDIVVLHGLGGDPFTTWTADNKRMWPRDFIPEIIPTARIMTFGYNSKVAFSPSTADIKDFALDLLTRLRNKRWSAEEMNNPIFFICHSLGGIVCKQALLLAQSQPYYTNIFEKTSSILFFGCPHRGSRVASWGTVFANVINTTTFHKPVQKGLLTNLSFSSQILADISTAFKEIASDIDIKTFYETAIMLPLKVPVVERDSAILGLPTEQTIPIAANHREMVRFANINSEKFDPVKFALREVKEGRPLDVRAARDAFMYLAIELNVADYDQQLMKIPDQYPGTCEWLPKHASFCSWYDETDSDTLWLRGYAGAGKSVMTKYIIAKVLRALYIWSQKPPLTDSEHHKSHGDFLAYFFCSERNRHLQSERNILRSLLHQMLLAAPFEVNKALQAFRRPSAEYTFIARSATLWDAVKTAMIATSWQTIYLVFDGLDEMASENLGSFVKGLKHLIDSVAPRIKPRRIKLLLTSRPMSSLEALLDCPSISVRSERDVKFYVQGRTNELARRFALSHELQTDIVEKICQKAGGMFLWAVLAWHELCHEANKPDDFSQNLVKAQKLPASLEFLYEDIMNRLPISCRELALKILTWLALSARPLHSCELRFAIAMNHKRSYQQTVNNMISEHQLRTICPALIAVSDDGYVQFVHTSIKEFFLRSTTPATYRVDIVQSHANIAIQSLRMLHMPGFDAKTVLINLTSHKVHQREDMLDLPTLYYFLSYAATNWQYHAGLAGEDLSIWEAFKDFLNAPESVKLWLMLALYDGSIGAQRGWSEGKNFWQNLTIPPRIHIAVYLRNQFLVARLVQDGADINAVNRGWRNAAKEYRRPIMSVGGTILDNDLEPHLVDALVRMGANVNANAEDGLSAITRAINDRDEERVSMLLSAVREARTPSNSLGYVPSVLFEASSMTMRKVVSEILDDPRIDPCHDSVLQKDTSILGTWYATPLEHACLFGMESIAQLMMEHPRMIKAQQRIEKERPGRSPISLAFLCALQGWSELTLFALQNFQVDLSKERDVNRRSILIHAVMEEWHDVLEHCVNHLPRSKLNIQDKNGMTALHYAGKVRNWYAAKRLLEAGADSYMEDNEGRTPAHTAAEAGSDRVLRIMLDRGTVDTDGVDHNKRTVLHYVATWNLNAIAETLIDIAPDQVKVKDHHGRTPVHLAALFGSTAVLAQMLSTGLVDVNIQDNLGRTAFHLAVEGKVESCINELLSRQETDLNILDRNLKSPLDITLTYRHPQEAENVRNLLEAAGCRPGLWRPRRSYGNTLDEADPRDQELNESENYLALMRIVPYDPEIARANEKENVEGTSMRDSPAQETSKSPTHPPSSRTEPEEQARNSHLDTDERPATPPQATTETSRRPKRKFIRNLFKKDTIHGDGRTN